MLQVPIDPTNGKIAFPKVGTTHEERIVAENYPDGTILQPFNGSMTHWEFIGNPTIIVMVYLVRRQSWRIKKHKK